MQGSHDYGTGTDEAAPVDTPEPVHLVIANAAKNGPVLEKSTLGGYFAPRRFTQRRNNARGTSVAKIPLKLDRSGG